MPTFTATITSPAGGTINLQTVGTYKLERSTRDNRQVTKRKIDATNPFVEGTYTVAAVKENVTENVSIYVYASSQAALRARIAAVTDCLDQIRYTLTYGVDGNIETWTCFSADYSIQSQQEFQHAYMALIRANVPRLPKVT